MHSSPEHRGRKRSLVRAVTMVVAGVSRLFARAVERDIAVMFQNGRLILGTLFVIVGVLSFASDRYCDGNVSSYYACTRPSTYYYYPWWAIVLVLLGTLLLLLWWLRHTSR